MPVRHDRPALNPCLEFTLMSGNWGRGGHVGECITGWAEANAGTKEDAIARLEAAWAEYKDEFIAEAREHGFEPGALTGRAATGPGFKKWRAKFLRRYAY